MTAPIARIDLVAAATLGSATGVGELARSAAAGARDGPLAGAVRFMDQPLLTFGWHDGAAFLTLTDAIALGSAAVLLIRFAAWALGPVMGARR